MQWHVILIEFLILMILQTVIFTGRTCVAAVEKRDRYPSWRSAAHSERNNRNSFLWRFAQGNVHSPAFVTFTFGAGGVIKGFWLKIQQLWKNMLEYSLVFGYSYVEEHFIYTSFTYLFMKNSTFVDNCWCMWQLQSTPLSSLKPLTGFHSHPLKDCFLCSWCNFSCHSFSFH